MDSATQCRTDSVVGLLKSSLNRRSVSNSVQQDKIVNHPVVASCSNWNAGIHQLAGIGLAFVPKRVVFGSDYESGRQPLEFILASAKGET